MQTSLTSALGPHLRLRALLLSLLSVALLAAIAPAAASAQTSDDQNAGNQCDPDVDADRDDQTMARISLECPVDSEIGTVTLRTTEGGSVEGRDGTTCERVSNREFECQPEDGGRRISAQFTNGQDDSVCAEPRLMVDFEVNFSDDTRDETIENVEVRNCPVESGDDEATPEGGIDSGAGGTALRSSAPGPAFPALGVVFVLLAAGGLVARLRAAR
ncbi:MAG: hypothetical protein AVDCRST_MAG17-2183 [uncultured Solirubrobacterales bacterium]|uniref:Uncharacterized protein n=1 Tax=uncultured Solirubrobacterales bacterium TaxID=768556 RepID=A0A6J4T6A0_9ACTN|nr:MAG: hypothetical protein AVDCRST_MAG17-2183 [uncultured Solirubrobacterales bacterium]